MTPFPISLELAQVKPESPVPGLCRLRHSFVGLGVASHVVQASCSSLCQLAPLALVRVPETRSHINWIEVTRASLDRTTATQ